MFTLPENPLAGSVMPGDETALLAALAAGDRAAAERLVEVTYRGVFSFLRRLCGDPDLAADLTQDTYRKGWDALASFDGRSRFSTWLARIAYNTFLNHLRRPRRLVGLSDSREMQLPDPAPPADEVVVRAAADERLRRAVLALPEELRYTVSAVYWGELPIKDLARQEGLSAMGVRKRLKRAHRLLAQALEETLGEDLV